MKLGHNDRVILLRLRDGKTHRFTYCHERAYYRAACKLARHKVIKMVNCGGSVEAPDRWIEVCEKETTLDDLLSI